MSIQPRSEADDPFNQSPPYVDVDLYASDPPLQDAVAANGGAGEAAALSAFGRRWGSAEMLELARQANENPPKLKTFDAKGFRRDTVEFHPAYHHFMAESIAAGLQGSTWRDDGAPAPAPAQVVRTARFYMAAQVETGHLCPITMTRAAVAALVAEPRAGRQGAAQNPVAPTTILRFRPWWEKTGITLGMGMTERQGGTDVRTNTTPRRACGRGLCHHRQQMVHVRADVRRAFWCWRRRRAGSPAFSCRASAPTARSTGSTFNA